MRWKRILVTVALATVGLAVLVYATDYAVFRWRVSFQRNAYGSVTVQTFDAVQKKNGKTQFLFDPPQPETCVNALLSHDGYAPCWYLKRHTEQGTNI
jgi:hypothetical protein